MTNFFQQIEYSLEQQLEARIFRMQTSNIDIFEPLGGELTLQTSEREKARLRNRFMLNGSEIQLELTQSHLLLFQSIHSLHPTHICKLTFALKFEVIYESVLSGNSSEEILGIPVAFKLEKQQSIQTLSFQASHPSIIEKWALELEKKINQRNFHKLFKAKRKIGKGAFATVYLAQRLRDRKLVAVKAFSKEKQYSSEKGRESLENQITLMRRLSHPNIMRLEGVYETDNSIYVILEYLQGQQLNQLIKSGQQLPLSEVRKILKHILSGLSHLSDNRIIHRDLKPQNILLRGSGEGLAICDFGLATFADQEKYLFVRCGTPGFVAPQIINIKDLEAKSEPISDVFSAGIILHYLLLGCSIFQGKKYNEILAQNRTCDFDFTHLQYKSIKPFALDLLKRMLERLPGQRISAQEALSHPFFDSQMDLESNEESTLGCYLKELQEESSPKCGPKTSSTGMPKLYLQNLRKQIKPFILS